MFLYFLMTLDSFQEPVYIFFIVHTFYVLDLVAAF